MVMAISLQSNPKFEHEKLTRFELALMDAIAADQISAISDYVLFAYVAKVYSTGSGLYLRSETPSTDDFRRIVRNLIKKGAIRSDPDFGTKLVTLYPHKALEAEEAICKVDPFSCISHLSAMQRYGLTHRRPRELYMTTLERHRFREAANELERECYLKLDLNTLDERIHLTSTKHPKEVRGHPVHFVEAKAIWKPTKLRGSFTRISTIGRVFVEMLERPELCGGMRHVMEVFERHAELYIDEILEAVLATDRAITKVRAGYLLEEHLGLNDSRVFKLLEFAQRGGSRVLDPSAPYVPRFSEKWMISLNV